LFFRILNRSVDIHYDIFILIQYLSNWAGENGWDEW
jgi:hypothetical protein